jgi:superfamily II DNA/RNA helicase
MREKEFLPQVESALGVKALNPMQRRMLDVVSEGRDIVLLSPTGSGKTLAFVLPMLKLLKPSTGRIQAVVIAPSRELVLQIGGIIRRVARGVRCVEVYGGHKVEDEVNSLKVTPDVVVGTPGRLLDHLNRRNVDLWPVRICVLDEFDKTLELGFEHEVSRLMAALKNVSRVILTSATQAEGYPEYIKLNDPLTLNYLGDNKELQTRLKVFACRTDSKDKLESLLRLLYLLARQGGGVLDKTIVFVNHRESAERVCGYLRKHGAGAVMYHGALDQREREKALALFIAGARNVLVSTDLGARGLDIEGVKHVVHYHQPLTEQAFVHRNGRTARVEALGAAYLMLGPDERPAGYVHPDDTLELVECIADVTLDTGKDSLYISAGKREKLSKGDILGWLVKDMGVDGRQVGAITVGDHYALVTLPAEEARRIATVSRNHRIKGEKRPVHLL